MHECKLSPVRVINGNVPLVVGSCVADGNGTLLLAHFWKLQTRLRGLPRLKNLLTAANKNDLLFIATRITHVIDHLGMVAQNTSDRFVVNDLPKLALVNL